MKKKILLSVFGVLFAVCLAFGFIGAKTQTVSAASNESITAVGEDSNMTGASKSSDSKSATFTSNQNWGKSDQTWHTGYVTIGNASGQTTVSFSISATANAKICLGLTTSWANSTYNNNSMLSISSFKIDGLAATQVTGKNAYIIELTANAPSKLITITLSEAISTSSVSIVFAPYLYMGLQGNLVIENIYYGAGAPEYTMEGAAIRLDSHAGIRFEATLEDVEDGASYGMIIFPKNVLDKYSISVSSFDSSADYIDIIDTDAKDYIDYLKGKGQSGSYTISCTPKKVGDVYKIYGTISNVLYNNMNREFFGLAYKELGGVRSYASFENDNAVRSLSYVADEVYEDYCYSELEEDVAITAVLNGFLTKAAYQAAGVSESAYNADTTGGSISVSLNKSSTTINVSSDETLTTSVTVSGEEVESPKIIFTSSDTSVATVSEDGTVTGVAAGTATITATFLGGKSATCSVTVQEVTLYNVTVTGGTTDKAKAATGATVTVTATVPDGKVFSSWTVTAGGVTLSSTTTSPATFTMGSEDVSITANFANAVSYETISAAMKDGNFSVSLSDSDKQVDVTSSQGWTDSNNGAYFKITTSKENIRSVTFTITNTSSNGKTIKLGVCAQDEYGTYKGKYEPSAATVGGSSFVSSSDGSYGAKLNGIAPEESKEITFTFGTDIEKRYGNSNGYISFKIAPYETCEGATFSISKFVIN